MMSATKKLIFAPLFLLSFAFFSYSLLLFLVTPGVILSLDLKIFMQMTLIVALATLSSFFFIVFSGLASNWRVVFPVALVAGSLPAILLPYPLNLILGGGSACVLIISYPFLANSMQTYINFSVTDLFSNPIKNLAKLLILVVSVAYFFSSSADIKQHGFGIPDSLIDPFLNILPQQQLGGQEKSAQIQIPKDQLELIKQNPDLLKKYGVDQKQLDALSSPTSADSKDLIKQTVKTQVKVFTDPYLQYIPALLASIFFITLYSFYWPISFIVSPIVALFFWILEKTGFLKFTTETREVKKMVV